jgi:hypothetical protein
VIFGVTEEVRATDASLSTCVRKGTRAIATGDVRGSASRPDRGVGHAAARASTGTRRTVHGEKVACVFQARAPENGAATRTERRLRSSDPKGGGETCAGTRQKRNRSRDARVGRFLESLDRRGPDAGNPEISPAKRRISASLIGGENGRTKAVSASRCDPSEKRFDQRLIKSSAVRCYATRVVATADGFFASLIR